jgi:hypothetical protein
MSASDRMFNFANSGTPLPELKKIQELQDASEVSMRTNQGRGNRAATNPKAYPQRGRKKTRMHAHRNRGADAAAAT